ncbi:hypothetical protein SKAU_G00087700 [Synaphobranchus kaupii]|uniref:Uncharacterized protein n=1 Tax=Synaphobranchus kaupii TaxID=118154 RepID=A0A9Q1FW82_SYNKA|nr:hypothetical protein SKAU_G00087700 [Synaphobranchus kaupii]
MADENSDLVFKCLRRLWAGTPRRKREFFVDLRMSHFSCCSKASPAFLSTKDCPTEDAATIGRSLAIETQPKTLLRPASLLAQPAIACLPNPPLPASTPAASCHRDTTTRTLILFSITRSNIWTDSNTWANTFQAHFDVGIVYIATVRPSGPSAVTTSSASALPLPTTLTTTVSAAAATAASGAHAITPAAPQQQLYKHTAMPSGPSAVTTSSASALPLPTTLPATATTARPSGPPSVIPAAPEQQLAVDERSVPGMDRVDSLAEYLVGLRTETGQTLNNQQASTIIALWQNLLPYDQQRVAYAARHQGTTCLPQFLLLLRLSHLYWYAPLLHHPSPAPNISTTCLEVLQDRQWSRGSLQLWPNIPILHRLSARGCKLRGGCSLSRHLHLHLPLCLLSPTPPLSLAHLCF